MSKTFSGFAAFFVKLKGDTIGDENTLIVLENRSQFMRADPHHYSGVFDLANHRWVIPNIYHSAVKTDFGFRAFKSDPKRGEVEYLEYAFDGNRLD